MTQQPLLIVRAWQEKSYEVSIRSKDRLIAAVNKGFDAMGALLDKDSDPADVKRILAYLNVERSIALEFDEAKDDSLHDLVYGLLESLHASLNEWNEERNQKKETGEISTQTEEGHTIPVIGPTMSSYEESLFKDNHSYHNQSTIPDSFRTIPIELKEEPIDIHQSLPPDYQISASELMRDEKLFKDEEMDNENNQLIAANSDPILSDSLNILEHALNSTRSLQFNSIEDPTDFPQILPRDNRNSGMGDAVGDSLNEPPLNNDAHRTIQPSDVMDYQMDFDNEPSGDPDLPENNLLNEVSMRIEDVVQPEIDGDERAFTANDLIDNEGEGEVDIDHHTDTTKDTPDSVKVDKRRRSSRNVSKPVKYNELMRDSDGDGDPPLKKSAIDPMVKANIKRRSFKSDDETEVVSKRARVEKKNDTELECPECEFQAQTVISWVNHLRSKHSTTPALAGLALLCECGLETLTEFHSRTCAGNTTVIRKSDGPQCVQCEMHPKTAYGYARHLRRHHNSTLTKIGIYLKCSCGLEVRSHNDYKHLDDCNPHQFTLHKLDD